MDHELTLMYLAKNKYNNDNNDNNNKIIDKKYYRKNKKKIYEIIKNLLKNKINDSNTLKEAHEIYINEIITYMKNIEINEKQKLEREKNNNQTPDNIYNKELMKTNKKSTLDNFVKKVNLVRNINDYNKVNLY